MRTRNGISLLAIISIALVGTTMAHDTWVEVNPTEVRIGQVVHVDLKLGNHGNDHRDFKLASKITLEPCTLAVVDADGKSHDLKSRVADTGFAAKEGYWTARFVPTGRGIHVAWHTLDTLHGATRAIKSSKSYFVVGDAAQHKGEKFDKTAYSATMTFNVAESLP